MQIAPALRIGAAQPSAAWVGRLDKKTKLRIVWRVCFGPSGKPYEVTCTVSRKSKKREVFAEGSLLHSGGLGLLESVRERGRRKMWPLFFCRCRVSMSANQRVASSARNSINSTNAVSHIALWRGAAYCSRRTMRLRHVGWGRGCGRDAILLSLGAGGPALRSRRARLCAAPSERWGRDTARRRPVGTSRSRSLRAGRRWLCGNHALGGQLVAGGIDDPTCEHASDALYHDHRHRSTMRHTATCATWTRCR